MITRRKTITAATLTALAAGFVASVLLGAGAANAAPFSCGLGGTSLGGGVCELTYTSGSNTFTPPARTSKLEAVLVGGGGGNGGGNSSDGFGGGGGEVKLQNFTDTSTPIVFSVGGADTATTATQSTTTTANPGGEAEAVFGGEAGISGNGIHGADFGNGGGGGGAGASPTSTYDGGIGQAVNLIAPSGSLFTGDTACYGGGGAAANLLNSPATWGTASCGGGYVQNGTTTFVAAVANTGGGGPAVFTQTNSSSGASGVVVVRWQTESTVNFSVNGHGAAVPAQDVVNGTTATQPTTPTASGYIFKGWYTDASLTTLADFSDPITADTTLYASWSVSLASTGVNDSPLIWVGVIFLVIGGTVLLVGRRLRSRTK